MPVVILTAANGLGTNSVFPYSPPYAAGSDRTLIGSVVVESTVLDAVTAMTIGGVSANITSVETTGVLATIGFYIQEADIPSIVGNAVTFTPAITTSSNIVITAILLGGTKQGSPYLNSLNVGWDTGSQNNTQNAVTTLTEVVDGMAVYFTGCSKTNTTWGFDGTIQSGGQFTQGTNTAAVVSTKAITTAAEGVVTTITSGLATDKVSWVSFMIEPAGAPPDVTAPVLSASSVDRIHSVGFRPSVITDTGEGTIYTVVVPDGDAPSIAQVKAGQQSNGSAALIVKTKAIIGSGVQVLHTITSLAMTTSYEVFHVHTDTAGNDSATISTGVTTGSFGLNDLIGAYTTTSGVLISPHAASNSSGAGYDEETGRVGIIRNNAAQIHEYDQDDLTTIIRTITLNIAELGDTESVTYMGSGANGIGEIAVSSENGGAYIVSIFELPEGIVDISINVKQQLTLAPPGVDTNSTIEGLTFDKILKIFWVCGEGLDATTPRKMFRFARPVNTTTNYTYLDAELTVYEPFNAQTFFASYGATGATFDLSGLSMDMTTGNLLVLSHTGAKLLQLNVDVLASPVVVSELDVSDLFQAEGVEVFSNGRLLVMGEANEYTIRTASLAVSIAIAQVVETDVPTVIPVQQNLAAELIAAQEVSVASVFQEVSNIIIALQQASSTNVSNAINKALSSSTNINVANEFDISTSVSISSIASLIINQSSELNLSQSYTISSSVFAIVSQSTETNLSVSNTLFTDISISLSQSLESNQSLPHFISTTNNTSINFSSDVSTSTEITFSSSYTNDVFSVTESNVSTSATTILALSIALTLVNDSSVSNLILPYSVLSNQLNLISEIDQTDSITFLSDNARLVNRTNESNLSVPSTVSASLSSLINPSIEVDSTFNIVGTLSNSISILNASDVSSSNPITFNSSTVIGITRVLENNTSSQILSVSGSVLNVLQSLDTSLASSVSQVLGESVVQVLPSVESSVSNTIIPSQGAIVLTALQASELDSSFDINSDSILIIPVGLTLESNNTYTIVFPTEVFGGIINVAAYFGVGKTVTILLTNPITDEVISLDNNTCVESLNNPGVFIWDTTKLSVQPSSYQEYIYSMTDGVLTEGGKVIAFNQVLTPEQLLTLDNAPSRLEVTDYVESVIG